MHDAQTAPQSPTRILRQPEVVHRVSIGRETLRTMELAGKFPKRLSLTGSRSVGWLESEIEDFLTARAAARKPVQAH
jgi:predicted DNA-binding transcriptional regulator AlpA